MTQEAQFPSLLEGPKWPIPVLPSRSLIHDRDSKFSPAFDTVFNSEGLEIVRTTYRAPNANAFAKRWNRSIREGCLDHLLVLHERHLQRVLQYCAYFNHRRPRQGLISNAQYRRLRA